MGERGEGRVARSIGTEQNERETGKGLAAVNVRVVG